MMDVEIKSYSRVKKNDNLWRDKIDEKIKKKIAKKRKKEEKKRKEGRGRESLSKRNKSYRRTTE